MRYYAWTDKQRRAWGAARWRIGSLTTRSSTLPIRRRRSTSSSTTTASPTRSSWDDAESQYFVPVPRPRKRGQQIELDFAEFTADKIRRNDFVNQVRDARRPLAQAGRPDVTPTTRRLLEYWSDPERDNPILFAQREAAETAIYLAEAAQKQGDAWIRNQLNETNAAQPRPAPGRAQDGDRLRQDRRDGDAHRLADAEQGRPAERRALRQAVPRHHPGLTIRDRLRVLLPEDDENYYKLRGLVPADLRDDLGQAKIVITNYHQLQRRETKQGKAVGSLTKELLAGQRGRRARSWSPGARWSPGSPVTSAAPRHRRVQRRGAPLLPRPVRQPGRRRRHREGPDRRREGRGEEELRGRPPLVQRPARDQREARRQGERRLRPVRHAVLPVRLRLPGRAPCSPGWSATSAWSRRSSPAS